MKKAIFIAMIAVFLFSCDTKDEEIFITPRRDMRPLMDVGAFPEMREMTPLQECSCRCYVRGEVI